MKRIFLFISLVFISLGSLAQVSFKAHVSKYKLTTDQRLRISFEVVSKSSKTNIEDFNPPTFNGFKVIMGPSISKESSSVNFKSVTNKVSITYFLQPTKTGKITIGKSNILIDGKRLETQPVSITVEKGKKAIINPNDHIAGVNGANTTSDVVLIAEISNTTPYVNQAVLLTYKLYIPQSYGYNRYNETKQPKYNGFWVHDLIKNIEGPYQGVYNNKPYRYHILHKKLLFPQQSGKLTIKPLTVELDVYNFGGRKTVHLTTGTKIIQVKALPTKNQPADFTGAVGNFDINLSIDKNQVPAGKAANIRFIVKGTGNLKMFDLPKIKTPEGLEKYEPKHTEHSRPTAQGNSGSISEEYVVVPNSGGKYIIPGIRFVYFDPKSETYITKTTKDLVLFATGQVASSTQTTDNNSQSNSNYRGSDFRFIKDKATFSSPKTEHFYGSKTFKILLFSPFILALLAFGYYKYQSLKVYDEASEKQKKSKALATKFLKQAHKNKHDKESFYTHLEKAIHNFIKAKLKIDTSEMSKEKIEKNLQSKGVSNDKIKDLLAVLHQCEIARYTPNSASKIEEDYKNAERIMNQI